MFEVRQLGGALTGSAGRAEPDGAHPSAVQPQRHRDHRRPGAARIAVRDHLTRARPSGSARTPPGDTYLNFLDLDGATPERIRAAYSAADWHRWRR